MPKFELEIRSFLSDEEYEKLRSRFDSQARLVKEDDQVTMYYSGRADLRLQKNNAGGKIWFKSGEMHDEIREEIEIKISAEDFDKATKLWEELGYEVEIVWFRYRRQYEKDGAKITLDDTKGYGKIIELEILSDAENNAHDLQKLKIMMNDLGVKLTDREEFETKFAYYKENWRELTKK